MGFGLAFIAFIFLFSIAYLIGNILGAQIVGYRLDVDLSERGSGNMGATNSLRVLGKGPSIVVFLIDFMKGFLGGFLIYGLGMLISGGEAMWFIPLAMTGIVVGHCYPVMNNFKGGKGVSTTWGVLLVFNWPLAIIGAIVFVVLAKITKISSLSTLLTWWSVFLFAWLPFFWSSENVILLDGLLTVATPIALTLMMTLVTLKHKSNIINLINGEEKYSSTKTEDKHTDFKTPVNHSE